jgi:hypothetical protein
MPGTGNDMARINNRMTRTADRKTTGTANNNMTETADNNKMTETVNGKTTGNDNNPGMRLNLSAHNPSLSTLSLNKGVTTEERTKKTIEIR